MHEIYGNMWEAASGFDAVCITTNGSVRNDGCAVMGRGCALEASANWPTLSRQLGEVLRLDGNVVQFLGTYKIPGDVNHFPCRLNLMTFPVKRVWHQRANLELIERSAHRLVRFADVREWAKVLLPRPGCGNGHLKWVDVKQVIEPLLDDRFSVITRHETDK